MKFQKGNKLSRGGIKGNKGGRPTKSEIEVRKQAEKIAYEWIASQVKPIMETWLGLACGQVVERMTPEGKKKFELKVDPATVRHAVDKLVPFAATKVEHGGAIGVYRIDAFDLTRPDRKRLR